MFVKHAEDGGRSADPRDAASLTMMVFIMTERTRSSTAVLGLSAAVLALAATYSSIAAGAPASARDHWAYRRPVAPSVPAVKGASWVKNPLDAFVLAGLEGAGLAPRRRRIGGR